MKIIVTLEVEPRSVDDERPADAYDVRQALEQMLGGMDYEEGPIAFGVTKATAS